MAKMTSGLSSIVNGVQSLGIKVPSGITKMLTVLQTITSILSAIQTISTVSSLFHLRRGGIVPHAATGYVVPGNDTTDRTLVAASSGELILNRAQQGVIASLLTRGGGESQSGTPYVLGQNIYLGTNNYLEQNGQGQLVTTQMLRQRGVL